MVEKCFEHFFCLFACVSLYLYHVSVHWLLIDQSMELIFHLNLTKRNLMLTAELLESSVAMHETSYYRFYFLH